MKGLKSLLQGGDLRTIGRSNQVVSKITNQKQFDNLFSLLHSQDRFIVMRAADSIEKITIKHKEYLLGHKSEIQSLIKRATNKELKWHLALMCSRIEWSVSQLGSIWNILCEWSSQKEESKIVRVNSIQALHDLAVSYPILDKKFTKIISYLSRDKAPSIQARLRKLKILNPPLSKSIH